MILRTLILILFVTHCVAGDVPVPSWLPPVPDLKPPNTGAKGNWLTPAQGQQALDHVLHHVHNRSEWEIEAAHLKNRMREATGLNPYPKKTPLNPIVGQRHYADGYAIDNVAFEAVPGYYVTGNLYWPTTGHGPYPLILTMHGHTKYENGRMSSNVQYRAGILARMGAIVLAIDMVGFGESMARIEHAQAHKNSQNITLHIWGAIRAIDLLCSLNNVDATRIGATGESGGGTQTFLLSALDDRITVSVPVVMVSSYFFGGCPCESGLPLHHGPDHFITNAGIAALAAPRPQLLISDGKDWTAHNPTSEYPFLQTIYNWYGKKSQVENAHFAHEGHDYGPSKRAAMYPFMAHHLGLDITQVYNEHGVIDESVIHILPNDNLRIFPTLTDRPANELPDVAAVIAALKDLQ